MGGAWAAGPDPGSVDDRLDPDDLDVIGAGVVQLRVALERPAGDPVDGDRHAVHQEQRVLGEDVAVGGRVGGLPEVVDELQGGAGGVDGAVLTDLVDRPGGDDVRSVGQRVEDGGDVLAVAAGEDEEVGLRRAVGGRSGARAVVRLVAVNVAHADRSCRT
uniref:Uncharacterized protein n=1 Tax=Streptomyces sp. FR1 TaxID=349971 RepID=I1VH40_9ACTN|nr:hypothetical protein pFP4.39c [Streptomyces sp. FR1]